MRFICFSIALLTSACSEEPGGRLTDLWVRDLQGQSDPRIESSGFGPTIAQRENAFLGSAVRFMLEDADTSTAEMLLIKLEESERIFGDICVAFLVMTGYVFKEPRSYEEVHDALLKVPEKSEWKHFGVSTEEFRDELVRQGVIYGDSIADEISKVLYP